MDIHNPTYINYFQFTQKSQSIIPTVFVGKLLSKLKNSTYILLYIIMMSYNKKNILFLYFISKKSNLFCFISFWYIQCKDQDIYCVLISYTLTELHENTIFVFLEFLISKSLFCLSKN